VASQLRTTVAVWTGALSLAVLLQLGRAAETGFLQSHLLLFRELSENTLLQVFFST